MLADKYIEYDPVIVFVDLILIEKPAYRHLLYNSNFKSYWKLVIILWLAESFRAWFSCEISKTESKNASETDLVYNDAAPQDHCNFYSVLLHTAFAFVAFICTVILVTELKWFVIGEKPYKYSVRDLSCALIVGGCGKLLGFLGIVWRHIASGPYYLLIQGYTVLCLFTAYSGKNPCKTKKIYSKTLTVFIATLRSHIIFIIDLFDRLFRYNTYNIHIFWLFVAVVCKSGKGGSLIGLIVGFLLYSYICTSISKLHLNIPNITLT